MVEAFLHQQPELEALVAAEREVLHQQQLHLAQPIPVVGEVVVDLLTLLMVPVAQAVPAS